MPCCLIEERRCFSQKSQKSPAFLRCFCLPAGPTDASADTGVCWWTRDTCLKAAASEGKADLLGLKQWLLTGAGPRSSPSTATQPAAARASSPVTAVTKHTEVFRAIVLQSMYLLWRTHRPRPSSLRPPRVVRWPKAERRCYKARKPAFHGRRGTVSERDSPTGAALQRKPPVFSRAAVMKGGPSLTAAAGSLAACIECTQSKLIRAIMVGNSPYVHYMRSALTFQTIVISVSPANARSCLT